jgi:hypothetical protein
MAKMRRVRFGTLYFAAAHGAAIVVAGLTLVTAGPARASGDAGCGAVRWAVPSATQECASRIVIAPGNDSRINLELLASDRAGQMFAPADYPPIEWPEYGFGHAFLDWQRLRDALFPRPRRADGGYGLFDQSSGTRCDGLDRGATEFDAAMSAARDLPAAERNALGAARARLAFVCGQREAAEHPYGQKPAAASPPDWPQTVVSPAGQAFLAYLRASETFYGEHWDEARQGFAALVGAPDPWVAQTARYMLVRVELGAAQAGAFDQFGGYMGIAHVDQVAVGRAEVAMVAYRTAYPDGRYRASLDGLERRRLWLGGDFAALDKRYETLFGTVAPQSRAGLDLVAEADNKLLFNTDATHTQLAGPLLLATMDLVRMRQGGGEDGQEVTSPPLAAAALAAQEPAFAHDQALFAFLKASHAYYLTHDYRAVLAGIPDESHQSRYSPLAFSAQVLRGLALGALHDGDEERFWRDLSRGADALWQGPTVQLALATSLERQGLVAKVFAKGSVADDGDVRQILLIHAAGPSLLRQVATGSALTADERRIALSVLLYKLLSRGDYAGFLGAIGLAASVAPAQPHDEIGYGNRVVAPEVFVTGKTENGYACAALQESVGVLVRQADDPHALLCLGEFLRLNGLDGVQDADVAPVPDQLGSAAHDFPGRPLGRGPLYPKVIANPSASADDKAYAMYRLVLCYAPGGNDSCGGLSLAPAERKALFLRLKHDYPANRWAQKLRFYW